MIILYIVLLILTGIAAGIIGSLSGLGGAVVLIPVLTLLLGVPIEYAAGTALVATIANSSGAASAYVKSRLTNIRIGMSLEIATTGGAIIGALVASIIYAKNLSNIVFIIFGIVLFTSIIPVFVERHKGQRKRMNKDWTTNVFQLHGKYYDNAIKETVKYSGFRWWFGEAVMAVAGFISGLLGVGSGTLKVLAMDWGMGLPMKATTATSNFMIGVTAAAGAAIYWSLGYVQPLLCAPVILGILAGSYYGSKKLEDIRSSRIRALFLVILAIAGIEMILRGFGVS